jgi:chemotaxis protein methyltransferase CheR
MNDISHSSFGLGQDSDRIRPNQFKALAQLIYAETGISIKPTKQTMLEGRLRRRARAVGLERIDEYCDRVINGQFGPDEMEHLINAVTTNKTDFFREPGHFDYLIDTILPMLGTESCRQIRGWSAACSTGAEPYTLAMLLDDFVTRQRGMDYQVIATDIDTEVLATAVKGIYPRDMIEPVSAHLRRRYVLESRDPKRPEVRIAPELRRKVAFGRLNLMEGPYPVDGLFHLIFCRNVLIYFDKKTQEEVVIRLCERLLPGGHLFLGHAESITGFNHGLTQVGGTIFRKPA